MDGTSRGRKRRVSVGALPRFYYTATYPDDPRLARRLARGALASTLGTRDGTPPFVRSPLEKIPRRRRCPGLPRGVCRQRLRGSELLVSDAPGKLNGSSLPCFPVSHGSFTVTSTGTFGLSGDGVSAIPSKLSLNSFCALTHGYSGSGVRTGPSGFGPTPSRFQSNPVEVAILHLIRPLVPAPPDYDAGRSRSDQRSAPFRRSFASR